MRNYKTPSNDPIEIGICSGCGYPIYSNENYWLDGDNMIHADGVGARATVIGQQHKRNICCLFLYLQRELLEDEVADAMRIEKKKAYGEE